MRNKRARKPEPAHIQGTCITCKERPQRRHSNAYRAECRRCESKRAGPRKRTLDKRIAYRAFKKDACEWCGFVPADPCQLDVDHINCDHSDNREDNLQTLCANCHRLKTKADREKLAGFFRKRPPGYRK